jgi:hypothetical protein
MTPSPDRHYYLDNFQTVLAWVAQHYDTLLIDEERAFIARFPKMPVTSKALLVRMVTRKGTLFRASRLQYEEIGCPRNAALALIDAGWVDDCPLLGVEHLFALLRKGELAAMFDFPPGLKSARKAAQLAALLGDPVLADDARMLRDWFPEPEQCDECIYHLHDHIDALCERIRLMFFGNLHQDWSELVLSELGIFNYEKVTLSAASQSFSARCDIDDYLHLHRCRERFDQDGGIDALLHEIPAIPYLNDWLEERRAKLLFKIAQRQERSGMLQEALRIYAGCPWPGSRARTIRVLERCGQIAAALALADFAAAAPESDAERQQLHRSTPRLRRALGQVGPGRRPACPIDRLDLTLPNPGASITVEALVRNQLSRADAPVIYVENTLINSLFGLLCWDAIFAAVPGAFFHPFQNGPADLLHPDFCQRRAAELTHCLTQLESDVYRDTILRNFNAKAGIQSPFVYWGILSEELLMLALHCIPAAHLRKSFQRILMDIRLNCSGYPDLIQFWPDEQRYCMIEVKGPGDRLQDNQIRWLEYCATHGMPVTVCYVQWAVQSALPDNDAAITMAIATTAAATATTATATATATA